jgi:hypothetical protein
MKIVRGTNTVSVELTIPEARLLLEELLDVPRGSKMQKVKQICDSLAHFFRVRALE